MNITDRAIGSIPRPLSVIEASNPAAGWPDPSLTASTRRRTREPRAIRGHGSPVLWITDGRSRGRQNLAYSVHGLKKNTSPDGFKIPSLPP